MKWHYGLLRKTTRVGNKLRRHYEVVEVYDEEMWSSEPERLVSETPKEMVEMLGMVLMDISRFPVYEVRKGKLIQRTPKKRRV